MNATRLDPVPHRGNVNPYFSDLVHEWLSQKLGMHEIVFSPNTTAGWYSVRVSGILIGWVDDFKCMFELASGEVYRRNEVRRRREKLLAADPLLFDKIWERMKLIDKDVVATCGYSITEYRK
jgi:hypothetical protein